MSRRSRMEVIGDILAEASGLSTKTRIMYGANLNFLRFEKYFSKLLDNGLIVERKNSEGSRVYITTEKGKDLLKILKNAEKIISV